MFRSAKKVFALLTLSLTLPLTAQTLTQLQTLNDHFVGTWVGTNLEANKTPPLTTRITITVAKTKDRLDMDYLYVEDGKPPEPHYKRSVTIEPAKNTVIIDRKDMKKVSFTAEGLDNVLRDGYGDFTLDSTCVFGGDRKALERIVYHLSPDAWNYEIFASANGKPFVELVEMKLKRTNPAP